MSKKKIDLFDIGDIVTFKTHPMFGSRRIKGDSRAVPPIMIVISILVNDEDISNSKYDCVYFDDDHCDFKSLMLNHYTLRSFEDLLFEKISDDKTIIKNYKKLIDEVKDYPDTLYEEGKMVFFKTKKLEIYKKKSTKSIKVAQEDGTIKEIDETLKYVVSYASPDFILCGIHEKYPQELLHHKTRRLKLSQNLVKVKWFNFTKKKFSEQILSTIP